MENFIFFAITQNEGYELRAYDGSTVSLVIDASFGTSSGSYYSTFGLFLEEYKGSLFFTATNGTAGYELWKTDGTTSYMVSDINSGSGNSTPSYKSSYNEKLYFTTGPANGTQQLMYYEEVLLFPTITFEDAKACQNDATLLVPITIDDISSDLGAISLVFDYDPAFMTYDQVHSSHTNLNITSNGSNFQINDVNGKVYISWADPCCCYNCQR